MNLGQIRERTNDRLNQAVGDYYPDEYLNRVINEARRDILNEIDGLAIPQLMDSVDITVTSAKREYTVFQAGGPAFMPITSIVEVVRVLDDGSEQKVHIRPYSMRNSPRAGWGSDCYVYQQPGSVADWVLGTIAQEPAAQTLRVYYRYLPPDLYSEMSEEHYVPHAHQDLIPVRAAILVLEDENREIGNLAAIYAEKMDRMKRCLRGAVAGHASKPW